MRTNSKIHQAFVVIELNMLNEDMIFYQYPLGKYCFDTYFGGFEVDTLNLVESNKLSNTLH